MTFQDPKKVQGLEAVHDTSFDTVYDQNKKKRKRSNSTTTEPPAKKSKTELNTKQDKPKASLKGSATQAKEEQKADPYQKAKSKFESEKEKREAIQREKEERAQLLAQKQQQRKKKGKKLNQRTQRGQPIMKNIVSQLLPKVEHITKR